MSANNSDNIGNSEYTENSKYSAQNQFSDSDNNNSLVNDGINFNIYTTEHKNIKRDDYKFHSSKITTEKNRPFNNKTEENENKLKNIKKAIKKQALDKQTKYNTKNELKILRKNRVANFFVFIKKTIWQGKKKIITLVVLFIVIPAIIIIPQITANIIKAEAEKRFAAEVAEGEQKASEILSTVNKKMFIDPNNYDLCEKIYIDAINNAQSDTEKVFLSVYYALFLIDLSSDYEKATIILENANINNAGVNAKKTYYDAYIKIYDSEHMDDNDKYTYYNKLRNEL